MKHLNFGKLKIALLGLIIATALAPVALMAAQLNTKAYKNLRASGQEAFKKGDYAKAQDYFSQALKQAELVGKPSKELVNSLVELAGALQNQGKFDEAEPVYRRALEAQEAVAGPNRMESAFPMFNLGTVCRVLGKHEEALKLFQQTEKILEQKYDKYSPVYGITLSAKAKVYEAMKDVAQADESFKKALTLADAKRSSMSYRQEGDPAMYWGTFSKTIYGPNNELVAEIVEDQGDFYRRQNRLEEAAASFRRLLKLVDEEMTRSGEMQGRAPNKLAEVRILQKQYAEAEALLKRVLGPQKKGLVIPPVWRGMALLQKMQIGATQEKYAEAAGDLKEMLALKMNVTLEGGLAKEANVVGVAMYYRGDDGAEKLERVFKTVVTVLEKTEGEAAAGPYLVILGQHYYRSDQAAEAETALRRALVALEKTGGESVEKRLTAVHLLGNVKLKQKAVPAAVETFEQEITASEKTEAGRHPALLPIVTQLMEIYELNHRTNELGRLHERVIAIKEKQLGAEHTEVADAIARLGELYLTQKNYAKAEPYMVRSYAIDLKARGETDMMLLQPTGKMVALYAGLGKDEEVVKLHQREVLIFEGLYGPKHAVLKKPLTECAAVLRKLKRDAEAEQMEARVKGLDAGK